MTSVSHLLLRTFVGRVTLVVLFLAFSLLFASVLG